MSTLTDADFWLKEADPSTDICDHTFKDSDFLDILINEFGDFTGNKKILEIGCGIGRLTNLMQYNLPISDIYGTDINIKFLDIAIKSQYKQSKSGGGINRVKYIHTDNLDNMKDFDYIYSVLLFQHLNENAKKEYIKQAYDALKDSGKFTFQFVEGIHSSRAMYDAKIDSVRDWCKQVGFIIKNEYYNRLCERWTWMTVQK